MKQLTVMKIYLQTISDCHIYILTHIPFYQN
jgi:hypothetical protein